jgi:glycosyltransferase involved in cell wall biosynthesis
MTRTAAHQPMLSIIVPTRGRPELLRCFLDSLLHTAARPERVEVVLVVDEDDAETLAFRYDGTAVKQVVAPRGLTMGALNARGYAASTGDRVMLCNDDVIVKTRGWDSRIESVFRSFPDEVVLVHVNDGTYKDSLCVFPCVSRRYAELAGGICPEDYRRYRIDDHIYNVFNLLAHLGEFRIQYLPDVLFEHENYAASVAGQRVYVPDPVIHEHDTGLYLAAFPARKDLAAQLKTRIRARRGATDDGLYRAILERPLDPLRMRDPAHVRHAADSRPLNCDTTRLTVGVVTADLRAAHAQRCLADLKRYTRNYDLVILDNSRSGDFNHAREMNRLIRLARTDYLVLMDDDVFVEPGWADALLACVNSRVGVVTPVHYDAYGRFNYAGVIMHSDRTGGHRHDLEIPEKPVRNMTLCSAIMLIDLAKCGHLRMDENYSKYFLDIDYGLSVWEAGYEVVCTPHAEVTHIGGATLEQGTGKAYTLHEPQRQYFARKWMATGRYDALESGIWKAVPEFERLRREGAVDEVAEVVESYKAHSIVFHENAWFGISEGYRMLTKSRIERRYYRRLVVAASLDGVKSAIDGMPYPKLLLHARIALYWARAALRRIYLRASSFGHRVLRALGFRAQHVAGKSARLLARTVQRLGQARPAAKNGRTGGGR